MTENFTDNNSIEKNIIHENEAIMGQNGASDNLSLEGEQFAEPVTPHNFNDFSYSKKSHFEIFQKNNYDKLFYGRVISPDGCDTKTYQNLLIFSFITQNIPEGKRILEIGCADNKVMNHFKYRYECWRIEDASLLTNTAVNIEKNEIEILKDNMGSIHKKLPLQHFDFIFSGSAFEQIPEDKPTLKIVLDNINRLLKPGGYSLHCFPGAISGIHFVYHRMLNFFFNNSAPLYYNVQQLTELLPLQKAVTDPDLQFIYEEVKREKVSGMDSYLKMVSFNFLYRKNISELAVKTEIRPEHYFRKQPCYAFHHLMKCGGTSVKEILQEWFNIKYDYIEDSDDLYSFLNYRLKTANFTGESCIIGHFQFDGIYLHQRYPEIREQENKFRIFTFIRDPLQFRASLYYYTKNDVLIKDYTLSEIIMNTPNLISKMFPCDESNYKEVLDKYFFIGIVEQMQESFDQLADLINKKRLVLPFVNKSEKDSQVSELTPEFIAKFKKQNKLDYLIYDYCLEKFNKM